MDMDAGYHRDDIYGTLQLVTISQSGAAPELFNVHASKTKE